jgi:hypothetical protein
MNLYLLIFLNMKQMKGHFMLDINMGWIYLHINVQKWILAFIT